MNRFLKEVSRELDQRKDYALAARVEDLADNLHESEASILNSVLRKLSFYGKKLLDRPRLTASQRKELQEEISEAILAVKPNATAYDIRTIWKELEAQL